MIQWEGLAEQTYVGVEAGNIGVAETGGREWEAVYASKRRLVERQPPRSLVVADDVLVIPV